MRAKRLIGHFKSCNDERLVDDTGTVTIVLRRCSTCGEQKELVANYALNGLRDGLPAYRKECKTCYNIKRKENKNKKAHSGFIGGQRRRGEEVPKLTHQEWKEAVIFFSGECAYCGATPKRGRVLTKDHLVAVSAGGTTTPDNIVPACEHCNSSKGNKEWRDWYMAQDFFSQNRMNQIFKFRSIQRIVGEDEDQPVAQEAQVE